MQRTQVQSPAPVSDGSSQPVTATPVHLVSFSGHRRHLHSHAHTPTQMPGIHIFLFKEINQCMTIIENVLQVFLHKPLKSISKILSFLPLSNSSGAKGVSEAQGFGLRSLCPPIGAGSTLSPSETPEPQKGWEVWWEDLLQGQEQFLLRCTEMGFSPFWAFVLGRSRISEPPPDHIMTAGSVPAPFNHQVRCSSVALPGEGKEPQGLL